MYKFKIDDVHIFTEEEAKQYIKKSKITRKTKRWLYFMILFSILHSIVSNHHTGVFIELGTFGLIILFIYITYLDSSVHPKKFVEKMNEQKMYMLNQLILLSVLSPPSGKDDMYYTALDKKQVFEFIYPMLLDSAELTENPKIKEKYEEVKQNEKFKELDTEMQFKVLNCLLYNNKYYKIAEKTELKRYDLKSEQDSAMWKLFFEYRYKSKIIYESDCEKLGIDIKKLTKEEIKGSE